MALGTFVPGAYAMTHDGVSVGLVESDGPTLQYRFHERPIDNTATYGDTKIDGIYRGGNCQLLVTFKEWNAEIRDALWPWSSAFDGTIGVVGRLASARAKQIILTATSGSPAAVSLGPNTFTTNAAILAADNDVSVLMGPDERNIPVLFDLLLYDASGTKRWFAIT
jgi:hypothetical protein